MAEAQEAKITDQISNSKNKIVICTTHGNVEITPLINDVVHLVDIRNCNWILKHKELSKFLLEL